MYKPTTIEKQYAMKMFRTYFKGIDRDSYVHIEDDYKTFTHETGVDKACLIFYNFDWVIKFNKFTNNKTNPVMAEAKNYQRAISLHLEEYFAPTYYIGSYEGIDIVLQAKLDVNEENTLDYLYEMDHDSINHMSEDDYDEYYENEIDDVNDLSIVIRLFGDEKLINFCYRYSINDLHTKNFGWEDGQAFIIDFSGFGRMMKKRSEVCVSC